MSTDNEGLAQMPRSERLPLSPKYDPRWVVENQMGPSALWLTEWLCEEVSTNKDKAYNMGALEPSSGQRMR